jgi:hypothetical protein
MDKLKAKIRKFLGISTEIHYCLNKVLTVQQKCDVIYANMESMAEQIKMRKDETVDNYNNINEIIDKLSYYSDYDLEEFEREMRNNHDSLDELKYTVDKLYDKLDAFTTDTNNNSNQNNDVYIVDDIEKLRPKIVSVVENVIDKYTVSVAASIRKIE